MKIWGDNPRVFGIYNQNNSTGKVVKRDIVASKRDEYKISGQAKDYQTVMKALSNIPDIRKEKVYEISRKIDTGRYRVEARDISDKIIKTLLGE
mgnify:CR=1 FL=1